MPGPTTAPGADNGFQQQTYDGMNVPPAPPGQDPGGAGYEARAAVDEPITFDKKGRGQVGADGEPVGMPEKPPCCNKANQDAAASSARTSTESNSKGEFNGTTDGGAPTSGSAKYETPPSTGTTQDEPINFDAKGRDVRGADGERVGFGTEPPCCGRNRQTQDSQGFSASEKRAQSATSEKESEARRDSNHKTTEAEAPKGSTSEKSTSQESSSRQNQTSNGAKENPNQNDGGRSQSSARQEAPNKSSERVTSEERKSNPAAKQDGEHPKTRAAQKEGPSKEPSADQRREQMSSPSREQRVSPPRQEVSRAEYKSTLTIRDPRVDIRIPESKPSSSAMRVEATAAKALQPSSVHAEVSVGMRVSERAPKSRVQVRDQATAVVATTPRVTATAIPAKVGGVDLKSEKPREVQSAAPKKSEAVSPKDVFLDRKAPPTNTPTREQRNFVPPPERQTPRTRVVERARIDLRRSPVQPLLAPHTTTRSRPSSLRTAARVAIVRPTSVAIRQNRLQQAQRRMDSVQNTLRASRASLQARVTLNRNTHSNAAKINALRDSRGLAPRAHEKTLAMIRELIPAGKRSNIESNRRSSTEQGLRRAQKVDPTRLTQRQNRVREITSNDVRGRTDKMRQRLISDLSKESARTIRGALRAIAAKDLARIGAGKDLPVKLRIELVRARAQIRTLTKQIQRYVDPSSQLCKRLVAELSISDMERLVAMLGGNSAVRGLRKRKARGTSQITEDQLTLHVIMDLKRSDAGSATSSEDPPPPPSEGVSNESLNGEAEGSGEAEIVAENSAPIKSLMTATVKEENSGDSW